MDKLTAQKTITIRRAVFICVAFCSLGAISGCHVPSPDWNGTWKLNPQKGNFQGPVFTISISADGEYHYDDGVASIPFRCDGKDQPVGKNRTRSCVKSSATVLDLVQKENGVKINTNHWELSADGQVLTVTNTVFHQNIPAIPTQAVALRTSGSNDFTGKWRDTKYLQRHADLTLRVDNHFLHIDYPNAGQNIDAPLNGFDTAVQGPHAREGLTESVRLAGRREFLIQTNHGGKAITQESMELSNDGRVITDSWWNPDRPNDKGTLIYEKK